jgi:acyl carrier protein
LTSSVRSSERQASPRALLPVRAFHERNPMSDSNAQFLEQRIAGVVQRLLAEHSIDHVASAEEDLRLAGLSSLDMVSLVLSVEEELNLMVPESSITPANFRSIASISRLMASLQKDA